MLYRPAANKWGAKYHIVNYSSKDQSVFLKYSITYLPASEAKLHQLLPVTTLWWDVVEYCGARYDLPGNGGLNTRSATFPINWEGTLVKLLGHLHRTGLDLSLVSGYDQICDSSVTTDDAGFITAISGCEPMRSMSIGQRVTISAVYNDTVPVEPGVMGIWIGYAHIKQQKLCDSLGKVYFYLPKTINLVLIHS